MREDGSSRPLHLGNEIDCPLCYLPFLITSHCSFWSCSDVWQQFALFWTLQLLASRRPTCQVQIVQHQAAFQKLKRPGRIYSFRAYTRALTRVMTTENASRLTCDGIALTASLIACVRVIALRRG
jgi:hypothetical protein